MKKINTKSSMVYDANLVKASFEYLGEKGYFSNYKDFDVYIEGVLKSITVSDGSDYPYTNKYDCNGFDYFIPKNFAVFFKEEPEKCYRPFKYMSELPFKVGDTVAIRVKKAHDTIYAVVNEIICNGDRINFLSFGTTLSMFSPSHCFNGYEILINGEWVPFGVLEIRN